MIGVFLVHNIMSINHGMNLLHDSSGFTSTPRHISKPVYNLGLIPKLKFLLCVSEIGIPVVSGFDLSCLNTRWTVI
jgi:hypothetical protein